jgi:hypothetical protein
VSLTSRISPNTAVCVPCVFAEVRTACADLAARDASLSAWSLRDSQRLFCTASAIATHVTSTATLVSARRSPGCGTAATAATAAARCLPRRTPRTAALASATVFVIGGLQHRRDRFLGRGVA